MSDILNDVLGNIDLSSGNKRTTPVEKIKTQFCCDVVLQDQGSKYILGTNQLFPIFEKDFLNGGRYDVQLYLYTALKWKHLFYTDMGTAVSADEDPDATLGYAHGIDIYKYHGASPCLAYNVEDRTLTVDQWCRLSHNALPVANPLPRLWRKAEGGHTFWTPYEGLISAIPVEIPMALESAEEFSDNVGYNLGGFTLTLKLQALLYEYLRDNKYDRLYIGYPCELTKEPEQNLVNAHDWSKTHCRRLGETDYDSVNILGGISRGLSRKLTMVLNNMSFVQEEIFA